MISKHPKHLISSTLLWAELIHGLEWFPPCNQHNQIVVQTIQRTPSATAHHGYPGETASFKPIKSIQHYISQPSTRTTRPFNRWFPPTISRYPTRDALQKEHQLVKRIHPSRFAGDWERYLRNTRLNRQIRWKYWIDPASMAGWDDIISLRPSRIYGIRMHATSLGRTKGKRHCSRISRNKSAKLISFPCRCTSSIPIPDRAFSRQAL